MTVSDQETEVALGKNLLACLGTLRKLTGKSMWLPLIGIGDGGLSREASLKTFLDVFQESRLVFGDKLQITIAAPDDISRPTLKRIRDMVRVFVEGLKPFADLRDSADMQDDRPTDVDRLGRTQYANALAKRINRMMGWGDRKDRTSRMIQLHAPWEPPRHPSCVCSKSV